ncbi:hypothetical protein Gasu2_32860 [Galdieria sulphuraria]|uniref:Uncharacterized protein n=1 Tax=Galdieria sulphuraria TaxID=130081 RepID=M2X2K4_GALSU|nr:uncharacterized protein Gasu_20760 [Galdieria sulphuraria]EME30615.1 hypothetical protein Gasu_20760 [Galdieria sulphuraria]GJD09012.1 hypothetical protein Gasu2_32860 [Galdieria sulphuraria]|eukprot:XP_005707135.1 hypothetical protein Gasu_20760 [Galdieria sulphuraria]
MDDRETTSPFSSLYKSSKVTFLFTSSQTTLLVSSGYRLLSWRRSHKFRKCYLAKCVSQQSLNGDLTFPSKKYLLLKDVQLLGIVPLIPNWVLLALYGYLGFRFFSGFEQTTYNKNSRLVLSILWPVMFIVNDRFRQNFKKALKQGDDEEDG